MGKNKKKQVIYDDFEGDYKKRVPKEKEKEPPEELNYMTEFEYKKLRCKNKREKSQEKNREKRNRKKKYDE